MSYFWYFCVSSAEAQEITNSLHFRRGSVWKMLSCFQLVLSLTFAVARARSLFGYLSYTCSAIVRPRYELQNKNTFIFAIY